MATMTHPTASFAETTHHPVVTATLVLLFWIVAAILIVGARAVSPISSPGAVAVKLGAIVATAFAYMRLTARNATVGHALFVGLAWLLLAVIAEIAASEVAGGGWFELIGSPASPAIRDMTLFAWIAAPALFARYE